MFISRACLRLSHQYTVAMDWLKKGRSVIVEPG